MGARSLLMALIHCGLPATARAEDEEKIKVPLGGSVELKLGFHAVSGICDDSSVVKVDATETKLFLVGVGLGTTKCGFRSTTNPNPKVYLVTVVPKKK
jgi:hypothetical protein